MANLHVALAALAMALPVQSLTPVTRSNCVRGHVIPEFYVLGAKNAATSSLAKDLRRRGVFAAPDNVRKEWQFFSRHSRIPEDDKVFELWLSRLPNCSKTRLVVADLSVTNLFLTKPTPDFEWSPVAGPRPERSPERWASAQRISHFHRLAGPKTKPPKFVVMLRDPLARIQSEYYHTLPLHNCRGCMMGDDFVTSLVMNMELIRQKQMSDWFWKSFYAKQIEAFEQEFNASQFMLVPNKEYYQLDPLGFSEELLSWLELPGKGAQPWDEASHANEHVKPPLDEELPPDHHARVAFGALIEPERQRLVRVLVRMHERGAVLPGYFGAPGDAAAVRAWLESAW